MSSMPDILIVEDEKAMQDIIADYMRKGGHTCFTADDGIDALVTLKNHPVDLMILDVMMPHLDGFSVCRMAREMGDMPIIMLTARSAEDDELKGYDYGADDYMTKPFSPRVLLAKVNALLRRSFPVSAGAVTAGKIMLQPNAHKVCQPPCVTSRHPPARAETKNCLIIPMSFIRVWAAG